MPVIPLIPSKGFNPSQSPRKPRLQRRGSPAEQSAQPGPDHALPVQDWAHPISQAILLDLLGQQPIAFHRVYVDLTGDVLAALWLSNALSKMASLSGQGSGAVDAQGVFTFRMTVAQCTAETGLSRTQQDRCRRILRNWEILTEHKVTGYVVDNCLHMHRLAQRMAEQSSDLARTLESAGLGGWPATLDAHNALSETETVHAQRAG